MQSPTQQQIHLTSTQLFIPLASPFSPHNENLTAHDPASIYNPPNYTTTINDANNNPSSSTLYPIGSGLTQLAPLYRVLKLLSLLQHSDSQQFKQRLRIPTFGINPGVTHKLLAETIPSLPTTTTIDQHGLVFPFCLCLGSIYMGLA